MGVAKKIAVGVGALVGVVVLAAGGGYVWASSSAASKLEATYDIHRADFPIPFPLTDAEVDSLRSERVAAGVRGDPLAGLDLDSIANERAVARGQHLTAATYGCKECHGDDFSGGVMVDDPAIGRLLGPNLTTGAGSRTLTYTAADWDRIVRHGVKPNGAGTPMPSQDFFAMSDRELSDIVAYIRSLPPVDNEVPPVSLGPVGKMLVATGQFQFSADIHPTKHDITHATFPPPALPNAEFGKHLAQTCAGCHNTSFTGGKIIGGPPDWPPAANLTPAGLVDWTYEDFHRALTEGVSKDGRALLEPMASAPKFAKNMTDVELQALWAYFSSLPPTPTGNKQD